MSDDLTILIPAAGRSSRMRGADKLLEKIDNQPLLSRVVARAAQVGPVRVVLAQGQDARAEVLGDGAEVIWVAAGQGMAASLAAGVAGLQTAVMILPADMPDLSAHDLATLAALWRAGAGPILRGADRDGTPGHPVIFPPEALADFRELQGDTGASSLLKARAKDVALYPLGPQALVDLDTPTDWETWRKKNKGRVSG